jgi:2-dehydropantoate 2-reductase
MRLCIFGAGAIGSFLAARLGAVPELELSLLARGPHLEAVRSRGLTLREGDTETRVAVRAVGDPAELGPQDFVFLTLKAHQVADALDQIRPLLGPETAVVTGQNGVPWWFFHRFGGPLEGTRIEAVDPGGRISAALGPERAIGCVVYPAAEIDAPGIVRHIDGDRFTLGEPCGERSERTQRLAAALAAGGLRAPVRTAIRTDIWVKLWGNLSFNPISALTGATLDRIVADPGTRAVARAMMVEAEAIAGRLGIVMPIDVDRRIAGAGEVGAHKTSMLQDLERGRKLETGALVAAVQELGRLTGTPTPAIDTVLALIDLRERVAAAG